MNSRFHSGRCPTPTSRGSEPDLVKVVGITSVGGRVLGSGHVAAAAPVLVAHAPPLDPEGGGVAVGGPLAGQRVLVLGGVAIFEPVHHLGLGARTQIAADVGVGAQLFGKADEFVSSELVGLGTAPPDVAGHRSRGGIADSVAPMVVIGKAPARPAIYRSLTDGAELIQRVFTQTGVVFDRRFRTDPNPRVSAAPQVFDEVAVEPGLDPGNRGQTLDQEVGRHGLCLVVCNGRSKLLGGSPILPLGPGFSTKSGPAPTAMSGRSGPGLRKLPDVTRIGQHCPVTPTRPR